MNTLKFYYVKLDLLKETKTFKMVCEVDSKWSVKG